VIARLPKQEVYIVQGKMPSRQQEAFRNGNPILSQSTHKFRLGEKEPYIWSGGQERVVDSSEFPISTTIAGVILDLKQGGLRELHWHPNADEWQLYIKGRARVGIFGAHGRSKVEEFGPGQVGFIQQGFGHYIEQIGNEDTQILVTFNAARYQEISLSTWLSNNPAQIIADNFGISLDEVARMPKTHLAIAGPHHR
jgi:oxalate decarboxylase